VLVRLITCLSELSAGARTAAICFSIAKTFNGYGCECYQKRDQQRLEGFLFIASWGRVGAYARRSC